MPTSRFSSSRVRRLARTCTFAFISVVTLASASRSLAQLSPEKTELKFGFIKLTDCAPLVIAKEKGFFRDEGLAVEVIAQPNWKTLLDNVISGNLDGAHMLSGQPIAATIGIGTKAHIVTAFTMDLNGNGITVSNAVWESMQLEDIDLDTPTPVHPISAKGLRPVVDEYLSSGSKLQMGMVFPVSTHNYEIRYWLAAAGIHPGMYTATDIGGRTDAEVELSVTPPPMMPTVLEAGNIQGYCVGEPWNQQAVAKGIGVPVTTNYDIWKNNPEKVFGVSKAWAEANPDTHVAVVKALIRAGKWLDATDASGKLINREEAVRILAQPNYVGADYDVIKSSMTGSFTFQKTDVREMPDFNVFFKYHATYPWYSDGIWFLTQMRRWGQITESKSADWYAETAKDIYLPTVYLAAAKLLLAEGHVAEEDIPWNTDGYKPATTDFIDGNAFDAHDPIGYINSFAIGNKDPI
ncbi:CmpA/NrtA family ABC transporter substrate-binding protein [Synoicihabitans lomoniglobus]|uniref:CmpA/NrtA family ABC transporter substrate-binding protein n=1 Tax=Synoicihabitans lomoniglobus TaxID=2909285 RepID=A0AAF0CRL0_9BACT|nr:ABC transporter substrate-binding protein [Opitutaceae bacterium LMO-M01]WED66761.1 CmpA/NrtA family ABC transporter substrate-binding protein [Opitutaceae bacterium LMO-M01]